MYFSKNICVREDMRHKHVRLMLHGRGEVAERCIGPVSPPKAKM